VKYFLFLGFFLGSERFEKGQKVFIGERGTIFLNIEKIERKEILKEGN